MLLVTESRPPLAVRKANIRPSDVLPSRDSAAGPFLRWAGGKSKIVPHLLRFMPPLPMHAIYHEPFVGAGSLFFRLCPQKAVLADANERLIACYEQVKADPGGLARRVILHAQKTCERYYYRLRDEYNEGGEPLEQAARFLYLNKTCFNGIFRVNTKGKFNVPYGWKEPPAIPSEAVLVAASKALKGARLLVADFTSVVRRACSGDFVYLDPPYPPLNGTAYFTHYTKDRFGPDDQIKVASVARELSSTGCRVLVSNADTPLIRELYGGFNIEVLSVCRYLTCKKKHNVSELVITNYPINGGHKQ